MQLNDGMNQIWDQYIFGFSESMKWQMKEFIFAEKGVNHIDQRGNNLMMCYFNLSDQIDLNFV